MKTKRFVVLAIMIMLVSSVLVGAIAAASLPGEGAQGQETDEFLQAISEETGMEARYTAVRDSCAFDSKYAVYLCRPEAPDVLPKRDLIQAQEAFRLLGTSGLLLVPDSTDDRVMAFDPTTGDLVDPNFIPSDPAHFITPRQAMLSASGDSILVGDQAADLVYEYDLFGNYVGIFAPIGGPNPAVLDNIRGMALRPNGNLLVTVGSGGNQDAVAEFDTSGNYLGNFIAAGAGGLESPFDIYQRSGDWIADGTDSDLVQSFDLTTGAYITDLAPINDFSQQLGEASNDNILVANFNGTQEGIVELTPSGGLVGVYNPAADYRGVHELPNDNFLTTTAGGVYEINRAGAIVSTKFAGGGGQYIEFISLPFPLISGAKSAEETVMVGDVLTYTISVINWGTNATGVVMTDTIPVGTTYVPGSLSCQGATGSCTFDTPNNQVTWNGDIDNGEPLTVTYAIDTDGVGCGMPIANQAIFSNPSTPFDTVLSHNASAWSSITAYDFEANEGGFVANTPPGEWAWGALTPSPSSPPSPISGSNLWATNLSGDITIEPSVHYLTKTLDLEAGLSQVTWWDWWHQDSLDSGSVSVNGTEVYSITANQTEWVFHSVNLTPWQGQTVDLSFFYNAVGSSDGGAGWYVDDFTVLGCPETEANFSASTKDAPATADSGSQFTYTIVIDNSSGVNATGTTMVDPIPAGLTYVNGTATGGATYNGGQNQIEWTGDIGPNSAVTITFMVEVTADSGTITNTATIDHSSTTAVQVSASTEIQMVDTDYKIYMPAVRKS